MIQYYFGKVIILKDLAIGYSRQEYFIKVTVKMVEFTYQTGKINLRSRIV